jgi:hypothetical protein
MEAGRDTLEIARVSSRVPLRELDRRDHTEMAPITDVSVPLDPRRFLRPAILRADLPAGIAHNMHWPPLGSVWNS